MKGASKSCASTREDGLYPRRYQMLDAFRGLAALAVVVAHVSGFEPLGSAAVMIFFVISGYCISAAADSARAASIGFRGFMWRRVRRIYPPYVASIGFFAITRLARDYLLGPSVAPHFKPGLVDWLANLTLTQWLALIPNPSGWPHENPRLFVSVYWSLCYEEQFYLVAGLITFFLFMRRTAAWSAITLASVAWIAAFPGVCFGWFVEYWPMFAIGCLVYARLCVIPARHCRFVDVGLILVAVLSFVLAIELAPPGIEDGSWGGWNGSREHRNAYGDLAIASCFALILIVLRQTDLRYGRITWLAKPLGWLGAISYSLYLVHNFNLRLSRTVAERFVGVFTGEAQESTAMLVQVTVLIGIASLFFAIAERPFLNVPLQRSAPGIGGVAGSRGQ